MHARIVSNAVCAGNLPGLGSRLNRPMLGKPSCVPESPIPKAWFDVLVPLSACLLAENMLRKTRDAQVVHVRAPTHLATLGARLQLKIWLQLGPAIATRAAHRNQIMTAAGKAEISMMIPVVFLILPVSMLFALWPSLSNLNGFM